MAKRFSQDKIESLWTVEDVMEFTKIPKSTIALYVATDQIPSFKIGKHRRFDPDEIRRWVKRKAS